MPRNMSVALTSEQVIAEQKDVTRRLGWWHLKPGDTLNLVNKTMGFKKGEHPIIYKTVRVKSTRREPVNAITQEDCRREGFPHMTPAEFIEFFCDHHRIPATKIINRIEWEYVK